MRAITIRDGRLQFRADLPAPVPAEDEVLLDVKLAGICETDLQLSRGYMGFEGIPGHEFVGVATGGPFRGQRVVGEINCNCRQCPRCESGLGNHCDYRTVVGIDRHDGAFAEHVCIPQHNLHPIPDSLSDDQAVFVEPVAAALQINQQVPIQSTDRIAVLGDGRLAYLTAQAMKIHTDHLAIVGKHQNKLRRFSDQGLQTLTLTDLCPRKEWDVVIDCTGSTTGLPLALSLVRPRGTVVMKTTVAAQHDVSLAPIVIDEITVIGSRCGPFDLAIAALTAGDIDVNDLITHRFPMKSAEQAMETAARADAFKVVFEVES